MAKALKTIGIVAGVVALTLAIPGVGTAIGMSAATAATVSTVASVVAVAANTGAALLARQPGQQGSSTSITIGATMPSPCIIGESYAGGSRVKQVGYGTEDNVPNAHALVVDVYSVAGPLTALVSTLCDFVPISFSGADQNAVGYFHNNLHRFYQLGATPEAAALTPHWTTSAPWGGSSKISGDAAILWNARWPKDGKVFAAGFPQTGSIWRGVPAWDLRLDSTQPGGSGSQRWADPVTDKVGFAAAKPTWSYTRCPSLHGLRYALGSWERDEGTTADYIKVFGIGLKLDQLVLADFVGFANTCDMNGWTVNGEVLEGQGISKWDNLKRILAAGGAQPVWKGGRLGLSWNAPRIAADTITLDDIAEGEPVVPGTQAFEQRKNTLIPKWTDPASKWAIVPSSPVQVTEWVTEDGEERSEEYLLEYVTDADQAAQVTGYALADRREQGPITFPLKPRLRHYPPGALLAVDDDVQETFGIREPDLLMTNRTVDPVGMSWVCSFMTDRAAKHDYALGLTGTSPPVPTITSTEDADGAVGAINDATATLIATSTQLGLTISGTDTTITISDHTRRYNDKDVAVTGATLTGLTPETQYYLYYDDPDRAGGAVTYHTTGDYFSAFLSPDHPARHFAGFIMTDSVGGTGTGGGGSLPPGGGGKSPYTVDDPPA